jgi:hypothetical protein
MINKLALAFKKILGEVKELRAEVQNMPAPKDGVSPDVKKIAAQVLEQIPLPKDGVSPSAEAIADLVLSKIPKPKDGRDGISPDTMAVVKHVLAHIPKPKDGKDGRDAQPVLLADVATVILAQIPKPKDGKDGVSPSVQAIVAQVPTPRPGKDGKDGEDGKSITDVKLERNTLFVWLDGVKKAVGKIELPRVAPQPISQGGGRGGATAAIKAQLRRTRPVYGTMAITQKDAGDPEPNTIVVAAHPSGSSTLNPPAGPSTGTSDDGPFGGYYKISAFIQEGSIREFTVANAEFTVPNDGVYIVPIGWAGFRHSLNNATISFVIGIERDGQMFFSQRPTSSKQPNGGDIENVSGGGQVTSLKGDKLSAWVASDTAGTITLGNSNFTIHMLEDTSI